jgi:hypothetical protein
MEAKLIVPYLDRDGRVQHLMKRVPLALRPCCGSEVALEPEQRDRSPIACVKAIKYDCCGCLLIYFNVVKPGSGWFGISHEAFQKAMASWSRVVLV